MFTRLAPVITVSLLAGCAHHTEQYHQETLAAINSSESQLTHQTSNLELQLSLQSNDIARLEHEIHTLSMQIDSFQQATLTKFDQIPKPVEPTPLPTPTPMPDNIVLGEIEKITIDSLKQTFDARVDTGAETSSLNAVDIEQFERNGKEWVRFHLSDGEKTLNADNWIEAPILRFVKIRQANSDEIQRRAMIELWAQVGEIHEKVQFTLADRSQMSHPVLLGREFIRDIAVVDVSRQYIHTQKNTDTQNVHTQQNMDTQKNMPTPKEQK